MAPDDHSGARPAGPVVLRIKLRYDDVATMVLRFAPNVGKSGLFLPTKSIQPIGTEVKFELRLVTDAAVLVGLGRVKHVRAFDPATPKATFGMSIELMRVSREGRELIIKMIERRRAMGLPDVAIPAPEDVDAARRASDDSQPRADISAVVRDAMPNIASAPVADQVLSGPPPSGPIGVAKAEAPRDSEAIASVAAEAPRDSEAIPAPAADGSSARRSVPVLAPEPTKARRPRVADLIAKASELSGQLSAAVPGLDEHVDVERAIARARALAGSDLDGELSALRESAAAPLEISIEAASAELARQLGGKPIAKRERSAKWVPPPAVEVRADRSAGDEAREPSPAPADAFVAKTRAETEASPSSVLAAITAPAPEPVVDAAPVEAPVVDVASAEPPPAAAVAKPTRTLSRRPRDRPIGSAKPSEPKPARVEPAPVRAVEPAPSPAARADAAAQEADDAIAEYAHDDKTRIPDGNEAIQSIAAEVRDRRSFSNIDEESLRTLPDARQSSGLLIDDHADPASFERILEGSQPAMQLSESDIEPLHDDDGGAESTQIGAMPVDPNAFTDHGYPTMADQLADQLDRQLAAAEAEADDDFRDLQETTNPPQPAYVITPFGAQPYSEVSDGDVLAEADAADADLLSAHGEADVHSEAPGYAARARDGRPSLEDFAARLDLGDDDDPANEFDERQHYNSVPQTSPLFTPHAIGEDFDEPHAFEGSVTPPPPARAQHRNVPVHHDEPRHAPPPSEDLEDALAALDVDLDDVAMERRRARRRSTGQQPVQPSNQRPLPGLPLHRPGDTGSAPTVRPRTGANAMVKPAPEPAPEQRAPRAAPSANRGVKQPTRPPPIPAAARRNVTTPPPIPIRQAPKRAPTDDGVVIDFDDDE